MGFNIEVHDEFLGDLLNLPVSCSIREVVYDARRRRVILTIGGNEICPTAPAKVLKTQHEEGPYLRITTEIVIPTRDGEKTLLGRDVYLKRDDGDCLWRRRS